MPVLTAYDAGFSTLLETAGVEVLLVGDSLGMVVQGQHTTVPVTLDDMIYHTRLVARGPPDRPADGGYAIRQLRHSRTSAP